MMCIRSALASRPLVLLALLAGLGSLAACAPSGADAVGGRDGTIRVATTTNLITDLAKAVGGERVEVTGLMGPGVDPHLYKASAADVGTLSRADIIFYGGLELEGKMTDVLEELGTRRPTVAVTRDIPRSQLLQPQLIATEFDPHVWFDVTLWKIATRTVADALEELDPQHSDEYGRRADAYLAQLDDLDDYVKSRVSGVPVQSRGLVTSHDAFQYFGRRYGFELLAIQGISTATEATTADIERIAQTLARRRIKSVFVESSVPPQTIQAVLAAANRYGSPARQGGELYSDAAGAPGTPEGTYIGMVRYNADVITEGLR